jgi:hypothetical protein
MKKLLLLLTFFLFSSHCFAIITDIGIDPLDVSSGAKALALGGAFAGASGDVDSLFYNPAGIANADGLILTGSDFEKFYIHNFSVGLVVATDYGHFGIGTSSKHYDDIGLNDSETINYNDDTALISYGIGFDKLAFGLTLKSSRMQRIEEAAVFSRSANNAATDYDAGILWKPANYASIGIVMRNISGTTFRLDGSHEACPTTTRTGLQLNVVGKNSIYYNDTFGLKAEYDSDNGKAGNTLRLNSFCGAEGSYNDWLFLRFGARSVFNVDGNVGGASAGLGFKFNWGDLDFASVIEPISQTPTSFISLTVATDILIAGGHEIIKPILKDLLSVSLPDDLVTDEENLIISGETQPKATLFINGAQAYVDNHGNFRVIQPLLMGKNLIQLSASLEGGTKFAEKKVLRNAKVAIAEEESIDKKLKLKASPEEKAKLLEEKKRLESGRINVENMVTAGVINVPQGSKFQMDSFISKGEMISWLVTASGMKVQAVDKPVFPDVPKDHKYAPYIKAALDAGLIRGDPDGKFRPDDLVRENEVDNYFKAFGISR